MLIRHAGPVKRIEPPAHYYTERKGPLMCTISINPASITAVPLGPGLEAQVSVSGTVANCTSNSITVTVSCPNVKGGSPAVISGGTWTATVPSKCICGSAMTITATCNDPTPCSATLTTTLTCNCCPQLSTDPICPPQYQTSGPALIKFVTNVSVPNGCNPVTVQRDFGDGTFGATHTYTSGQNAYVETHAYATGVIYTSTVNVLSPSSCTPDVISVPVLPPPPCATSNFVAAICTFFEFLFLLNGSAALVTGFATFYPPCTLINNLLPAIAIGFAIAALFALGILTLLCRKCTCRLVVRLLGQLVLIAGVLLAMFLAPGCVTLPLLSMLWVTLLVLLIGWVTLFVLWYQRSCCPLKICDFWRAVVQAMVVAVIAAVVVFTALAGGASAIGLAISVALAFAILTLASLQVVMNQNAGNC
jgi:hypothetical protein